MKEVQQILDKNKEAIIIPDGIALTGINNGLSCQQHENHDDNGHVCNN
jgi:hypothetical protein